MRGRMLWFHEGRDYGFISTEDAERLYVHGTGFTGGVRPKGRCAELKVAFVVRDDDGTRKAEDVHFVSDNAPRRARLRYGRARARP
jgi:cold shock CspA family protein